MSQENVETVREFMVGLAAGTPTAMETLDPNIEWHVEDTLPDPRIWNGHEGVKEFFAGLREVWEGLRFEADEYIEEADRILVAFRQIGHGAGGQVPVEQRLYGVFRMKGGRAMRFDVYFNRERALEAVGLSE
jgi:ketosteroid isomerase-like protein